MNKRGQGIQFNWIFVIIAGAIFLAFAVFFSVRYIDLERSKENARIVTDLDTSISGSKGISQYKEFGENLPSFKVSYDCENIIVNDDQEIELKNIIFMDDSVNGALSLWSKDYKRPYLIDGVVFIWNSDLKFYFSGVSAEFIDNLPNELKMTSESDADVLVYFGSAEPKLGKKVIAFNDNHILFVNEDRDFLYNGDKIFVYGAMFSSVDTFECSKRHLEERRDRLKDIYILKAQYLGSGCNEYSRMEDALRNNDAVLLESLNDAVRNREQCEVLY